MHRRYRLGDRSQLHVYGPLQNGATTLMYEGAPNFPETRPLLGIIERHKVKSFTPLPRRSAPSSVRRGGRKSTR